MSNPYFGRREGAGIRTRVVVTGDLIAQTPIHLGNGDGDEQVDLPLLEDPLDGGPLLTGTTLAGALRGYLLAREFGERPARLSPEQERRSAAAQLLGGARADVNGIASCLIVDDARARPAGVERRDGVALDPATRTAEDAKKFDLELWPAGTVFPLRFELLLEGTDQDPERLRALAAALAGFQDPEAGIRLGARKSRGYGQVGVERWCVHWYELDTPRGLLAWIAATDEAGSHAHPPRTAEGPDLGALLGVPGLPDQRDWLILSARFTLTGSVFIRAGTGQDDLGPDNVHLHARQIDGRMAPVLSGTSLAGALRARAGAIIATLAAPAPGDSELLDGIFGRAGAAQDHDSADPGDRNPAIQASRLIVDERVIEHARTDLVQSRVMIDRFTGGAFPGALYSEQPVFGSAETAISLQLRLINPTDAEAGLLLLLIKDLWTGDLPLGGEIGIGRGRLRGREAQIRWQVAGNTVREWTIEEIASGCLEVRGDRAELERLVATLVARLAPTAALPQTAQVPRRSDR